MSDKSRLPIFAGKNFSDWKFRFRLILEEKDMSSFIENHIEDIVSSFSETTARTARKLERECKSLLVQCLADNMLEYVKEHSTAKDMFDALRSKFEKKGILSQTYLRRKLLSLTFDESIPMEEFFLKFDTMVRDLKEAGGKIEENEIVSYLLLTLPSTYDPIISAFEIKTTQS